MKKNSFASSVGWQDVWMLTAPGQAKAIYRNTDHQTVTQFRSASWIPRCPS
jgi:hypothetical protein